MSDRRAFSAGNAAAARHHAGPSALGETWRVAVGGNRVESMTAADIAHAFQAGHLNVRTPLWPPGASGWQALGNFEQFQMAPPAYDPDFGGQLSHFQESDDDPTRMWTGSADVDLASMAMMPPAPPPPVPSTPPARPSMRTGPRPVSQAPRPVAPITSVRPATAAPTASPSLPPFRRKSNGWLLVAGLVGLVGLGSAVLATRGDWNALAKMKLTTPASAEAAPAAQPAPAAEIVAQAGAAEAPKPAEAKPADTTAAEGAARAAGGTNVNDVAKYEEGTASAFMGGSDSAKADPAVTNAANSESESAGLGATSADKSASAAADLDSPRSRTSKKALTKSAAAPKRSAMSSRTASASNAKRAAAPLTSKPEANPEAEPKAEEAEAAPPAEAAGPNVNQAAAAALANSAKLASSCRPRGGPAGSGKARIIYSQDGEVQSVEILTAKFRDTLTGSCVRMVFRRAKIPAFKGEPPTFIKSFTIPEE